MGVTFPVAGGVGSGVHRSRVRWFVVAMLFVFSFLTIVDRVAISAAKSGMAAELRIPDVQFGLIFGVFALGYAAFQIPAGWAADRYGPRVFLAAIVLAWSCFTGLTGLSTTVPALVAVRFLFGAAEAGIYPTASRAIYNWVPRQERGAAQGLLFIGSRLGAAFGLSVVSFSIAAIGWRSTFGVLAGAGVLLTAVWVAWFRDTPEAKSTVSPAELEYIRGGGAHMGLTATGSSAEVPPARSLFNVQTALLGIQYFASNFTFFIAFSWLLPYLQAEYKLSAAQAGGYASIPLYCGALGNWLSGGIVDRIYRRGQWRRSRTLPAVAGFALATAALLTAPAMTTVTGAVICFSIATLGVDMTLSPSWTTCQDLAGPRTGALSGAMNMVGNAGSFVSSVTFPVLLLSTGSAAVYFYLAAGLNLVAILCWMRVRPDQTQGLRPVS
jgi:ACS family glucarate transporter-like MFS transporter